MLFCLMAASGWTQGYQVLHEFSGPDGKSPTGEPLLVDGVLYGTTSLGAGGGKVFRINPDGSGFVVLKTLEGEIVPSGLACRGGLLYGITYGDGGSLVKPGVVFRLSTNGTGYTVLKQFNGSDGRFSQARPIIDGFTLYGTTSFGGSNDVGTVFKINLDGSGFQTLHEFSYEPGGRYPPAGVVLSDQWLYGTTTWAGGVFAIQTNGDGFDMVLPMTGSPGPAVPYSGLCRSGTTLYGTTYYGGDLNFGSVFKVNTDGTGLQILKSFSVSNQPYGGLVVSGDTLYGTTLGSLAGGNAIDGFGSVFTIKTNGSDYAILKNFNGNDGANPRGTLTLAGTDLYGTTQYGGAYNCGVVFRIAVPEPPKITGTLLTQTAEWGATVWFGIHAAGSAPLSYQWLFNGTNIISELTTNCHLGLTNLQSNHCGNYAVVVSNAFGAVTSAPAMLNVISPVNRRPVPAINLEGEAGSLMNVECTDALGSPVNWLPLDLISLTSTSQLYFDLSAPLPPQRFYRAWQAGTPSVISSLNLNFVPAITLTGNLGDALRLDYINTIGPTDAWSALDTVTLTNTSQLYFDVSAPGQPARLYRIVPLP